MKKIFAVILGVIGVILLVIGIALWCTRKRK